ncbi:MAG: thiamine-phosphate kinase [Pontibacterium sp.]
MGEFELIEQYFNLHREQTGVDIGIGDDCAVLSIPPNTQLAVSIDTLVEGTHFLSETAPEQLASRLIGAAASDLAAMGATPAWLTLSLCLPDADENWLAAFAQRLHEECRTLGLHLVGGDTTKGPLVLTAQVHGYVAQQQALTRHGAREGDYICVSGTLGDSRAGLAIQLNELDSHSIAPVDKDYLLNRFFRPTPRIALGQALVSKANACIDISDGLLADLTHILSASDLGAQLDLSQLPISSSLVASVSDVQTRQAWALSGGEDFELCFTLPKSMATPQFLNALPTPVTIIGEVCRELGIHTAQPLPDCFGFDHFKKDT